MQASVETESRKRMALEMSVKLRLTVVRDFTELYGSLTDGILEFLEYLIHSGRITEAGGSKWWRGCNGFLVLDLIDADAALRSRTALDDVFSLSPAVKLWINFALNSSRSRSSFSHRLESQKLWWLAHQTSLHHAISVFSEFLVKEPKIETQFITCIAIPNVDLVALLNIPTNLKLIKLYTCLAYPKSYPSKRRQFIKAVLLAPTIYARILGATPGALNIGLESTRWSHR